MPTHTSIASSYIHILPAEFQDLVMNNKDILNLVLFGELNEKNPYMYKKVEVDFHSKLKEVRALVNNGLIDYSRNGGKAVLNFFGWVFCDSKDALALHETGGRVYSFVRELYMSSYGEQECSLQELVQAVYSPPYLPERYNAVQKILNYFGTAPYHIVSYTSSVLYDNPSSNIKNIRGGSQVIDFKDFNEFLSASFETLTKNLNPRVLEPLLQKYSIKDEQFAYQGALKDQKQYRCFVIMPIGKKDTLEYENNTSVFEKIVKKAVDGSGYKVLCYHADVDLFTRSGDISKRIFEYLRDDDIVIADLRSNNVNVIYELGIRHAFGRRSILICSDYKENFFHNTNYTAIKYEISGKSNQGFFERMGVVLDEIIKNPHISDNPVSDSLGRGALPRVESITEEERWYKDKGGTLYNLLLKLREARLYLMQRDSRKFLVDDSNRYESVLAALGKSIKYFSTDPVFSDKHSFKEDLIEIGRKLEILSDHERFIKQLDIEGISESCNMLINKVLLENFVIWKKLSVYLLKFVSLKEELSRKIDVLELKWENINDDLFLVRNNHQITQDSEEIARELDFIGGVYSFEEPDKVQMDALVESFMTLHLPAHSDGGVGMRAFQQQYHDSVQQCRLLLRELTPL